MKYYLHEGIKPITVIYGYWMKYGIAIIGRLQAEDTQDLENSTLERVLGHCCGSFILPLAKDARDLGLLKTVHLTMDLTGL